MRVLDSGEIYINGNHQEYLFAPNKNGGIVFVLNTGEFIQVYDLSEFFENEYTQMNFNKSYNCIVCGLSKDNCATRLSHRTSDLSVSFSELGETDIDKQFEEINKPICESCIHELYVIVNNWANNNSDIVTINNL